MTTDTEAPKFDTLREYNRQLKVLLDDPHPGLASWALMYHRTMKRIVNWYTEEEQKEFRARNNSPR